MIPTCCTDYLNYEQVQTLIVCSFVHLLCSCVARMANFVFEFSGPKFWPKFFVLIFERVSLVVLSTVHTSHVPIAACAPL